MKQYSTFEDLQALGSEKIHERTHISRDKVELVMTKSYGEIGRVQFMGFLSILEREYGCDLNDIRQEYTQYWQANGQMHPPKQSVILQAPSNARRKWLMAGTAAIALLLGGGYVFQTHLSNEPREEVMKLSSIAVETLKDVADTNMSTEINATAVEANTSVQVAEANTTNAVSPTPMALKQGEISIHPRYKVWVGMIDMASGAKTQQITTEPIVIDTSKNWLLAFGHGMLEIDSAQGQQILKEKDSVRFVVENGSIKQLNRNEFMARNGGKIW